MQQAIIQILDDIAKESMESFWESIGLDVYPTWISTAKERIQAIDGWISTAVKLPPEDTNVLIFEWWQSNLSWWNEPKIGWYNKKFWFQSLTDYHIATHWMNLPDSPK
jgi:hypothetical protein